MVAPKKNKKPESISAMLMDPAVPLMQRKLMIHQLITDSGDEGDKILESLFTDAAASNGDKIFAKKTRELEEKIKSLEEGPVRPGTYLGSQCIQGAVSRVRVRLEDGSTVYPAVPAPPLMRDLQRGDTVVLDPQARAIIARETAVEWTGEVAMYERRISPECVEISVRGEERYVFDAAQRVIDALEKDELGPGSRMLVCMRRRLVMAAVPEEEGKVRYRFIDRQPVPDVKLDRDLGDPPAYIGEMMDLLRLEMLNPERRRRYRLRRCAMKLLAGISGSGKSYSLLALWRKMYELMAEVTGVAAEDLPPRVMRFRPAQMLSHWFGDSDRNIDRFFTEVTQLADEKFTTPAGETFDLPVLVILEEVDGMSRARGGDDIYDRIMATLLELLDPTRKALKDRLILFVGTTNVAHQMDMAFLRRIGGTIERFGHLTRYSFQDVLLKHLEGMPLALQDGRDEQERLRDMVYDLTSWLYSPNGEDRGQVELSFVGSGEPQIRHRRDFLTAGMVDRAVQQVAALACAEEEAGSPCPGLTTAMLKKAVDHQVRAIVDLLRPGNVDNYLPLPDGVRVQDVRIIEQPVIQPFELMRAS